MTHTQRSIGGRVSPAELARLLGLPQPTTEQARAIAAPLEPTVIIAGAGSGKSETMASRVVWMVANGLVQPEQVLGLTFTRKAAAELAARVRRRLDQLRGAGLVAGVVLDGDPTVSTYHSYAARLVADHALREAREPSARLITPAVQWQLAARVVSSYDGPMDAVAWTPPTVVAAVLELAGELSEHLRTPDDVRQFGARIRERITAISREQGLPGALRRLLTTQDAREQLLPLVERYEREKVDRDVLDHADQVSIAARLAERHPEIGAMERSRFRVVLLDEYQDTGHSQLVMLRSLFGGGHPVTAVGDPCQSIYGWRGASAGNIQRFQSDFPPDSGLLARSAQLTISFRNGERVLVAAGRLGRGLRGAETPRLRPGPGRGGRGRVNCALLESSSDEAEWVADQLGRLLELPAGLAPDGLPWAKEERRPQESSIRPGDIAILARKRIQFPALRRALERRGVPVEVVGLGGLLSMPDVQDVVATLRVMHDPTAGDALVRILTGPRWRIGPFDLAALGRRARELARSTEFANENRRGVGIEATEEREVGVAAEEGDAEVGGAQEESRDWVERTFDELMSDDASIVDALDDLGTPDQYSATGHSRLRRLADELRGLRSRADQPLPELIADVERTLGLDIEVAARAGTDPITARADLDALIDAAAQFAGDGEEPTLSAFLAYLKAAEEHEFGLEPGRVSEADSVKLMTVHAAKGLEWPVVVVPGLAGGAGNARLFPASPRVSTKWTDNARKLPFPLRGDRNDLPELDADLSKGSYERFVADCDDRDELEERRLAYVAATRASHLLLGSGFWWGEAKTPLGPSAFLEALREACLAGAGEVAEWVPPPSAGASNPSMAVAAAVRWPTPLGGPVHDEVVAGARLVEEAFADETDWVVSEGASLRGCDRSRAAGWELDARLLLTERAERDRMPRHEVELPADLSVSDLVLLAGDPDGLAQRVRRPLPDPPRPRARRGTAFHRWLEARYGQQRLIDPEDLPGAADDGPDGDLAELRRIFESGEWASRSPTEVEVPFETVVGDRVIRGRMDAVFLDEDGTFDVVDWKTGRRPDDQRAAAVQLAAYRLAWAELAGVPLERVRAAFYYVRNDETVRPVDVLDADGLAALVNQVPEANRVHRGPLP